MLFTLVVGRLPRFIGGVYSREVEVYGVYAPHFTPTVCRACGSQRQYIRLVDSSVGYFACAQYDVLFYLSLRGSIATAAIPWSKVWRVYVAYFFKGIATLALAMTYFFYCLCERSEANSREGGFP